MINSGQLRDYIIKPVLSLMQVYSDEAEELLVFTCATESKGGTYLNQVNGPALGIYQMEPHTYNDIWQRYLKNNPRLLMLLTAHFSITFMPDENRMVYDLYYATIMARIFYLRCAEPLPKKDDIDAIWKYYKTYWNTDLGKATKNKSIQAYKSYIET